MQNIHVLLLIENCGLYISIFSPTCEYTECKARRREMYSPQYTARDPKETGLYTARDTKETGLLNLLIWPEASSWSYYAGLISALPSHKVYLTGINNKSYSEKVNNKKPTMYSCYEQHIINF